MMTAEYPFGYPASPDVIYDRRAKILSALCAADEGFCQIPVKSVSKVTLKMLLRLYDEAFFSGFLKHRFPDMKVTLSPRLLSAAGKFVYIRTKTKQISKPEIRMSSDFLMRLEYGPFQLNGLTVSTPQEAFLIVFEHELCHALETALMGETGHSSRFLALANRFFGHTATTHRLPTRKTEAAQSGIHIGSVVSFVYKDRTYKGRISYVGKTATVMVQSATGEYRDQYGRRYTKYRVPLHQLNLV